MISKKNKPVFPPTDKHQIINIFVILGIIILVTGTVNNLFLKKKVLQTTPQNTNKNSLNTPPSPPPNSRLKYKIVGASSPIVFLVEVKFQNSYYNYDYKVEANDDLEGYLELTPPIERMAATTHVTAISDTGTRSKPLILDSSEWWAKVDQSSDGYAIDHLFEL